MAELPGLKNKMILAQMSITEFDAQFKMLTVQCSQNQARRKEEVCVGVGVSVSCVRVRLSYFGFSIMGLPAPIPAVNHSCSAAGCPGVEQRRMCMCVFVKLFRIRGAGGYDAACSSSHVRDNENHATIIAVLSVYCVFVCMISEK